MGGDAQRIRNSESEMPPIHPKKFRIPDLPSPICILLPEPQVGVALLRKASSRSHIGRGVRPRSNAARRRAAGAQRARLMAPTRACSRRRPRPRPRGRGRRPWPAGGQGRGGGRARNPEFNRVRTSVRRGPPRECPSRQWLRRWQTRPPRLPIPVTRATWRVAPGLRSNRLR